MYADLIMAGGAIVLHRSPAQTDVSLSTVFPKPGVPFIDSYYITYLLWLAPPCMAKSQNCALAENACLIVLDIITIVVVISITVMPGPGLLVADGQCGPVKDPRPARAV
jgi:hypothetical protein